MNPYKHAGVKDQDTERSNPSVTVNKEGRT